jgi:hypothetical protein
MKTKGSSAGVALLALATLAAGCGGSKNGSGGTGGSTVQTVFGLSPLLGGAANQTDLADLFTVLP